MRVVNNMNYTIYIGDIGATLPAAKHGSYNIKNDSFAKSDELSSLIKSGKVSAFLDSIHGVETIEDGDGFLYKVGGDVVWEGRGKTVPVVDERFSNKVSFEESNKIRNQNLKPVSKKYIVTKNCKTNISLEKAHAVLTKLNPSVEIDEDCYNSRDIQGAIASGMIVVSKVLFPSVNPEGRLSYGNTAPKSIPVTGVENYERLSEYQDVHCLWEGPIFDPGGYANMNRNYVINLDRLGVSVKPTSMTSGDQVEKGLRERIHKLGATQVRANCPKVYATNVPGKHSGPSIAYTMMETDLAVHKHLINGMKVAKELWVPSEWNKENFINSKVSKPVFVMPLGVDGNVYKPREKSVLFAFPVKSYVFYAVSTWLWRKGWDVLLKAYSKAFTADDDVSLVVFTHVPLQASEKFVPCIRDYAKNLFSSEETNSFPHFAVITSFLPTSVVPLIYNSANCFVLFSRGEGWGLPYCEASASGLPVIGADHGGQKMFLNNDNSLLVKPDIVTSCHSSLLPVSPFYQGMKFASYSDKAIDEAADKMRYAYEHQDEMKEKAVKCRENLLQNFNWDKCARRVADRLREIK